MEAERIPLQENGAWAKALHKAQTHRGLFALQDAYKEGWQKWQMTESQMSGAGRFGVSAPQLLRFLHTDESSPGNIKPCPTVAGLPDLALPKQSRDLRLECALPTCRCLHPQEKQWGRHIFRVPFPSLIQAFPLPSPVLTASY